MTPGETARVIRIAHGLSRWTVMTAVKLSLSELEEVEADRRPLSQDEMAAYAPLFEMEPDLLRDFIYPPPGWWGMLARLGLRFVRWLNHVEED